MSLLKKTRQINELIQQANREEGVSYTDMADVLGEILDANTYILDKDGTLIGYKVKIDIDNDRLKEMVDVQKFPKTYIDGLMKLTQTEANVPVTDDLTIFPVELRHEIVDGLTTLVPIYGAGERLGTIVLGRILTQFSDDDLVLAEYSATVVGMEILYQTSQEIEETIRGKATVQMAINTLSYSELKAVKAIFAELDGMEGRLTASNVADKIGITRSVIVNALRKLESAGVIESRSLGMKGTYIKIINPQFIELLDLEEDF